MPENRKKIGIFDAEEAFESQARDVAEAKLLEEQEQLKGPKLFDTKDPNYYKLDLRKSWEQAKELPKLIERVWKFNWIAELTRQRKIKQVKRDILSSGSLYGAGQEAADMEARHAVADRLVNELYEGNEMREIAAGVPKDTEAAVKALVEEYARGATLDPAGNVVGAMPDDVFHARRKAILAEFDDRNTNYVTKGLKHGVKVLDDIAQKVQGNETFSEAQQAAMRYADNMTAVAKEIRLAVAHGTGVEALVDELEFVTGKAKMSAHTEAKYNFFDKGMRFLKEKVPFGRFISETNVSIALAAAYSGATWWTGRSVRGVATVALGSGAVAAGTAAANEHQKLADERRLVAREMAKGKTFNADAAPRRKELAGTIVEPKAAQELMTPMRALFDVVAGERVRRPGVTQEELRNAIAALTELEARRDLMDRYEDQGQPTDLIAYSDEKLVDKERNDLFKLQRDAALAVRELLASNAHEHMGPDFDPTTLDYKIVDHVHDGREFANNDQILRAINEAKTKATAAGQDPNNKEVLVQFLALQFEALRMDPEHPFAVAPIESAYESLLGVPQRQREEKRKESYHRWDRSQARKVLEHIEVKKNLHEIKHFDSNDDVERYLGQLRATQEQLALVDDLGSLEDKQIIFEKMRRKKTWVAARNGLVTGAIMGTMVKGAMDYIAKPALAYLSSWLHAQVPEIGSYGMHGMQLPTEAGHTGGAVMPEGVELHPRNLAPGKVVWDIFRDGKQLVGGLVQHENGRFSPVVDDGGLKDLNEVLAKHGLHMTDTQEHFYTDGSQHVPGAGERFYIEGSRHTEHFKSPWVGKDETPDAGKHIWDERTGHQGPSMAAGDSSAGAVVAEAAAEHAAPPVIHMGERTMTPDQFFAQFKDHPELLKELGVRHISHRDWGDNDTPMRWVDGSEHPAHGVASAAGAGHEAAGGGGPHILSHEQEGTARVTKYSDGTEIRFDPTKTLRDHRFVLTHGTSHVQGVREYQLPDGRVMHVDPSSRGSGHITFSKSATPVGGAAHGSMSGNKPELGHVDAFGQPDGSMSGVPESTHANIDAFGQPEGSMDGIKPDGQSTADLLHHADGVIHHNQELIDRLHSGGHHEGMRHVGADGYEARLMDPVEKDGKILYVLKGMKPDDSFHAGHHVSPMAAAAAGKLRMLFSFGHGAKDVIEVPAHLDSHGNAVAEITKGSYLDKILHEGGKHGIKRLYENVEAAVVENDTDPNGAHIFTVATDPNQHGHDWKLPQFTVDHPAAPTVTPSHPPVVDTAPELAGIPPHGHPESWPRPEDHDSSFETAPRFGTHNTTVFDYVQPQESTWDWPYWFIPMRDRDPLEPATATTPAPEYYGYESYEGELSSEAVKYFKERRVGELKTNPNADVHSVSITQAYLRSLNPVYRSKLSDLLKQIVSPMAKHCRVAVCIPVAGHQESQHIKSTLASYLNQTASVQSFEIVLFVNNPKSSRDGSALSSAATLDAISEFCAEHPELPVRVMHQELDPDDAKIGNIRKILTDAVLERNVERGDDAPELYIISNDADNRGIAPEYIENYINLFDNNPDVDAFTGQTDWDPEAFVKNPLLHVGTRLMQYMEASDRRRRGAGATSGANSAFRAGIYAGVGGYDERDRIGEDVTLGQMIRASRKEAKMRKPIGFAGARVSRLYTSARRAIYTMRNGQSPREQWNNGFGAFDDEVRKLTATDATVTFDFSTPVDRERFRTGVEMLVNRTIPMQGDTSGARRISMVDPRIFAWLGIKIKPGKDGNIIVTNVDQLIRQIEEYREYGELLQKAKSGDTNAARELKERKNRESFGLDQLVLEVEQKMKTIGGKSKTEEIVDQNVGLAFLKIYPSLSIEQQEDVYKKLESYAGRRVLDLAGHSRIIVTSKLLKIFDKLRSGVQLTPSQYVNLGDALRFVIKEAQRKNVSSPSTLAPVSPVIGVAGIERSEPGKDDFEDEYPTNWKPGDVEDDEVGPGRDEPQLPSAAGPMVDSNVELPQKYKWEKGANPSLLDITKRLVGNDHPSYVATDGFEMSFGRMLYSWCKTAPDKDTWIQENINYWGGERNKDKLDAELVAGLSADDIFTNNDKALALGRLVHEGWGRALKRRVDAAVDAAVAENMGKTQREIDYAVGKAIVDTLPKDRNEREIMLYSTYPSGKPNAETKRLGIKVVNRAARIAKLSADPEEVRDLITLGKEYMGRPDPVPPPSPTIPRFPRNGVHEVFDKGGKKIVIDGYDTMERRSGRIIAVRAENSSVPEIALGATVEGVNGERAVIESIANPYDVGENFIGILDAKDGAFSMVRPSIINKVLTKDDLAKEEEVRRQLGLEKIAKYREERTKALDRWLERNTVPTSIEDAIEKACKGVPPTHLDARSFDENLGKFVAAGVLRSPDTTFKDAVNGMLSEKEREYLEIDLVDGFPTKTLREGEIIRLAYVRDIEKKIDVAMALAKDATAGKSEEEQDTATGIEIAKLLPKDNPSVRAIILLTKFEGDDVLVKALENAWAFASGVPKQAQLLARLYQKKERPQQRSRARTNSAPPSPAAVPKASDPVPTPLQNKDNTPEGRVAVLVEESKATAVGDKKAKKDAQISLGRNLHKLFNEASEIATKLYIAGKVSEKTKDQLQKNVRGGEQLDGDIALQIGREAQKKFI